MGLEIAFFVGAALLLAAIVYGVVANRRRNRANDALTDQATRELYRDENAFDGEEEAFRAKAKP